MQDTIEFNTSTFSAFAEFQTSQLGMQKCNGVDYRCEFVRQLDTVDSGTAYYLRTLTNDSKIPMQKLRDVIDLDASEALSFHEYLSIISTKIKQ